MTNKELVLRNINREIQENIDFNNDIINKNKDNKDEQDYIKYVSTPTIALLELGNQYMNNHYELLKPLENVFTKFNIKAFLGTICIHACQQDFSGT